MRASDLHLFELLDLHPDEGRLEFKNRRMLLWDADAFGNLRRELIESIGLARARPILRRFGFANGYRDALTTGEQFSWDNDTEWWLACPALQRSEGKVQAEPQKLVVDREGGRFEMEVIWHRSYEAEQHLRVFGRAGEPVCWTLVGFASGFSTMLMGEEVYVVEEECMAQGGERCRVVGTTRRAWGQAGAAHARDYEASDLSAELEAREAELRRHRRALRRRERELSRLRGDDTNTRGGIVSKSRAMDNVLDLAQTVARVDSTVLITGESGVGKELVARFVHDESPRGDGPFVAINCGALPEPLLESELFGHTRGAFTGADTEKKGLFEAARGGTLFLDEIGETSPATQVKLLRVLQEREVRPVGSNQTRPIDVRVVAATNRDLAAMVEANEFRKDLFYRLEVVAIPIPPLRERPEDILPLARELIATACRSYQLAPRTLATEAVDLLTRHRWPGNVRELHNVLERAVVLSGDRTKIERDDLPPELRNAAPVAAALSTDEVVPIADLERRYVLQVLDRFEGNRTHTARALGIGANTLWRKLKSWGVPPAREAS
jgi:two-component system, NtrC family, response regulator HydG